MWAAARVGGDGDVRGLVIPVAVEDAPRAGGERVPRRAPERALQVQGQLQGQLLPHHPLSTTATCRGTRGTGPSRSTTPVARCTTYAARATRASGWRTREGFTRTMRRKRAGDFKSPWTPLPQ